MILQLTNMFLLASPLLSLLPLHGPVHSYLIGTYTNHDLAINQYDPTSFTPPMTAAAAQVFALISDDYRSNPWP
jgi:hypothetical protein